MKVLLTILNVDILAYALPFLFDKLSVYDDIAKMQDELGNKAVLNQAIKMISFETFNPIKNLGGIYILLLIFFFRLAWFLIICILRKICKKRKGTIV